MYLTLLYYCFLLNLFVICLYLRLFNLIWGCYVPGGTHAQWRYSIMVYIILLCFTNKFEEKNKLINLKFISVFVYKHKQICLFVNYVYKHKQKCNDSELYQCSSIDERILINLCM